MSSADRGLGPDHHRRPVVTVVVPVYNAGSYLERCSPSLLDQSIGPDRYEVVYVDDGSTDGSGERLDQLAATHSHVRVHHQENSGWPGKPRNVGIRMARGDYVQFVDQDDQLGPEALERLHALAVRSSADIVIGMMAGTMTGSRRLFRHNVEGASVLESGAISTLTGHKMFRRDFLLGHDIWFPEGYWRMEDLLFVLRAYVRQPVVSVLADYPCYFWNEREDGSNHSRASYDVTDNFGRLHTLFDTVLSVEGDAGLRDALLLRLFRTEVLGAVSSPVAAGEDDGPSRLAHRLGVETARKYLTPSVRSGLVGMQSLQMALLEHGTWEDLQLLAGRVRELRPQVRPGQLRWEDGRLVVPLTACLRWRHQPLCVVEHRDGFSWDPAFLEGLTVGTDHRIEDPLAGITGDVTVRDRTSDVSWFAASALVPSLTQAGEGRFVPEVTGEVAVDPVRIMGGRPLPEGRYPLRFHGTVLGVPRNLPLRSHPFRQRTVLGDPPMLAGVSGARGSDHLELRVRPAAATLSRQLGRRPLRASSGALPRPGRPVSLDAGLPGLHLPPQGLDLTTEPIRMTLRRGPSGTPRLVMDRRTSAAAGLRRVTLATGSPGLAVVIGGRIWWFIGSGSMPRTRRALRLIRRPRRSRSER